jgi:hypothetical protein
VIRDGFTVLGTGYDRVSIRDAGIAIYTKAVRLAQRRGQIVGEGRDYFVTLEQLEKIVSEVHGGKIATNSVFRKRQGV